RRSSLLRTEHGDGERVRCPVLRHPVEHREGQRGFDAAPHVLADEWFEGGTRICPACVFEKPIVTGVVGIQFPVVPAGWIAAMAPRGDTRRPCVHVAANAVNERTDRRRLGGAV